MRVNKTRGSKSVPNTTNYNPKMVAPQIRVKDLNTMVFQQGVRVRVYKTLWCPNRKSIDGVEHEIDCKLCKGTSFIDIDCKESYAHIQSQTKEQLINPENTGYNKEEGVAFATFISDIELSYYSKIELMDYTHQIKELVQKQVGGSLLTSFTPTSYTASTGVVVVPDTVDTYLIRVNDVFIDGNGARFPILGSFTYEDGSKSFKIAKNKTVSLLAGANVSRSNIDRLQHKAFSVDVLIDEDGKRYTQDADFEVDRNGDIRWLTANKPADKSIYTILYNTFVAYRAIRAMHSNRYGTDNTKVANAETIEYPQQWVIKLLILFKKSDSENGQELEANQIFPKD